MSATTGIFDARVIARIALVASSSGQDTRTMSAPASSMARIWSIVARASPVIVLVIVCTVIGASPPTGTLPTMICRDLRRWMSRYARTLMALAGVRVIRDGLRTEREFVGLTRSLRPLPHGLAVEVQLHGTSIRCGQ